MGSRQALRFSALYFKPIKVKNAHAFTMDWGVIVIFKHEKPEFQKGKVLGRICQLINIKNRKQRYVNRANNVFLITKNYYWETRQFIFFLILSLFCSNFVFKIWVFLKFYFCDFSSPCPFWNLNSYQWCQSVECSIIIKYTGIVNCVDWLIMGDSVHGWLPLSQPGFLGQTTWLELVLIWTFEKWR